MSADAPQSLPWRIRLDKYRKQDVVVRADNSQTSLNEALALDLIGKAGLATQLAIPSRFTANGSAAALPLIIQNPDEYWLTANVPPGGQLYKAEANGDYSYRGHDASAYANVFDIEAATGADDYRPLIAFLKFVNQSTDAEFAAGLGTHLDVDAFATYLDVQDLVANSDDIDGPGNTSCLRYGPDSKRMTVVSWHENLAFGGGGAERMGGGGGMRGRSNALADRFRATADFSGRQAAALATLEKNLYSGGVAQQVLDRWVGVLKARATDLVPADTIASEASAISAYFA